jgi:cytochrome P450
MAVLFYLSIAVASWGAWSCHSLYQNYRKAQAFGFPIVIVPVGSLNPLWILIYNVFTPSRDLLRRLPFGLGDWVQYSYFGWTYHDGGAAHRTMGPSFVLCTPAYFEIVVADPTAALAVLTRRKEYTKPMIIYDTVNVFGPNVDGLEGENWQRHRRLTAPSLNDRVNPPVWKESSRQCREMITEWVAQGEQGTRRLREDIAVLALHVWLWAGFGISSPFREKDENLRPPHTVSYMEALFTIMNSFEYLCIFPMDWLSLPFMPASMKRLGRLCKEFKLYLGELVQSEKEAAAKGESTKVNLLSTMVRASEEEWEASKTQNTGIGLKDNEIFGNLFIYSFAGFETTANALATSIAYLAACPTWQDWLAEEITPVVGKEQDVMDLPFNETFLKLKRCLAILVCLAYC